MQPGISDAPITDLDHYDSHEQTGDCYLGTVRFFGVPHHATLIRVTTDAHGCQIPTADPLEMYATFAACSAEDGPFLTVKDPPSLPPGEYVIFCTPHVR